jgi:hypothetical protein
VSESKQAPPRDDAELAARVEQATRPAPWTPSDHARFRAAVEARVAPGLRARAWWAFGIAASAAAGFAALWIAMRAPAPAPAAMPTETPASDLFAESYEEQVLFAPEWIERDEGFVDAEVLPDDYALASALIEP